MKTQHLTNDERIAAIRGLSLKDFSSIKDLEYTVGILEMKCKQIKEEIRKRREKGKD